MTRAEAARLAGMERQALRDAVIRYNAKGVDGLRDRPNGHRPEWLTDAEQGGQRPPGICDQRFDWTYLFAAAEAASGDAFALVLPTVGLECAVGIVKPLVMASPSAARGTPGL